jgi:DUF1680 family protein
VVTRSEDGIAVNLYQRRLVDGRIAVGRQSAGFSRIPISGSRLTRPLQEFTMAPGPSWADSMQCRINGELVHGMRKGDYVLLERKWKKGDVVEMSFFVRSVLQLRDGSRIRLDEARSESVEAALFHGPWLMGISENDDPLFYGEPWPGNTLMIPKAAGNLSLHLGRPGLRAAAFRAGGV